MFAESPLGLLTFKAAEICTCFSHGLFSTFNFLLCDAIQMDDRVEVEAVELGETKGAT